jgi:tetratricopeptide (TPR) repeat protein
MSESTQPIKVKKPSRLGANLFSVAAMLILLGLSIFGGYTVAIGDRQQAASQVKNQQLSEQYEFALVDIQFGRYEAAKQRLDFIVTNDPNYPGVLQKLTEVMVAMSVPTATSTPLPTPTPNPTGAEGIFNQAKQLLAASDWANALVAIDAVRKADPGYKTGQVDGMYYYVLRNYGYDLITRLGNLEGGIYELTLAERFAPLDNTAKGLREGARLYIIAASFWEVNWQQAVFYLGQTVTGWPSLWDGTMTASNRYYIASMRYGDQLVKQNKYCDAVKQYQNATTIGELDSQAAKNFAVAYNTCYPPTEVPTMTPEIFPTATGVPVVIPTDTPAAP